MRLPLTVFIAAAALAAAAPATAATFCVHSPPGCAGTSQASLQAAIDAALANGGATKDRIEVGVGLFADGPAVDGAGNVVDIVGVAPNQTAIKANGSNATILKVLEPASSVAKLRAHVTGAGIETGLELAGDADDVLVTNQGFPSAIDGIRLDGSGATLRNSAVALVYGAATTARAVFATAASQPVVSDSHLQAEVGIDAVGSALTVRRTRIEATQGLVATLGAQVAIADSSVRSPGPYSSAMAATGLAAAGDGATTIQADRVTLHHEGPGGYGVWVAPNAGAGKSAFVGLLGSVADGWLHSFDLSEAGGSQASASTSFSAFQTAAVSAGAGTVLTQGANVLDLAGLDPGYLDAAQGRFDLRHDSPLVDQGNPGFQPFLGIDLPGHARVRDGDGAGGAVVDLGAYEYQRRQPAAAAAAAPATVGVGEAAGFSSAGSSDPDAADALSFTWSFDDGASASGPAAQHAFATPGAHTATLTVTDPAGLSATAAAIVTVTAPAGGSGGGNPGGGNPGSGGSAAPRLTRLTLTPAVFRAQAGRARRAGARRRAPVGARLRYTLSQPAQVTFTVQRALPGRRVGRSCRRPARSNRRRPACTRWITLGTFVRRSGAGRSSARFMGRVRSRTLPPGRYRLAARGRSAAGAGSAVARTRFRIVA